MYNEKGVQALESVSHVIESSGLPLRKFRKFNGILNAMEMQIEDFEYSLEVVDLLGKALLALAKVYELETSPVADALDNVRRSLKE